VHLCALSFLCAVLAQASGSACVPQEHVTSVRISLVDEKLIAAAPVWEAIPYAFVLEHLIVSSDVHFEQTEALYLFDMHEHEKIDHERLRKSLERCARKGIFDAVTLTFDQGTYGTIMQATFEGRWTFKGVKIQGVLTGKDIYRPYYMMEAGEPFSEHKHVQSLAHIENALRVQGYFNAQVTGELERNVVTRMVEARVVINRDTRFTIGNVSLELALDEEYEALSADQLKKDIVHNFLKRITKTNYEKEALDELGRSIKKYLARHGFACVSIQLHESVHHAHNKVDLAWHIKANNRRLLVFFGNTYFTSEQLLSFVSHFGRSTSLLPAHILAEEIERYYKDAGFWGVQIETREESGRSFFIIKEGCRARIGRVTFQGVSAFDHKRLVRSCFRALTSRGYGQRTLVQECLDALLTLYRDAGYLDVALVEHHFVPMNDERYELAVTVDEGERFYLARVTVQDHQELENATPFASVNNAKQCAPFKASVVQEQRQFLLDHFHSKGYLRATARFDLERSDHAIQVTWHVEPGERLYFGKTIVTGAELFPFEYIQRELEYQEGEIWDQEKIKRTFTRLRALEIFDTVTIGPCMGAETQGKQPVLIRLHKDDPFELRARAGLELQHIERYRTFSGLAYKVGGTFLVKNPGNRADVASIDVDIARAHHEIVAKYSVPWIAHINLRTVLQAYSILYDQPGYIGDQNNIYRTTQHGFLVGFSHRDRWYDSTVNIGFEWMQTRARSSDEKMYFFIERLARAIDFNPELFGKTIPYFFIEPTLFIDRLDNKLNPTQGTFSLVSCKGMFPVSAIGSCAYLVKILAEQACFVPIGPAVFALRGRIGHIFYRKFRNIMPAERFYLGGSHSLRGYYADLAPPLGVLRDDDDNCLIVPKGGRSLLNVNMEVRFPVIGKLGGVVFQDMGVLSGDAFADFTRTNVLGATGFGVRLKTPIGPLRFDIGWKWRSHDVLDRSYAWFLTFGQAF
jgi:outer membrane protein insertion porin family